MSSKTVTLTQTMVHKEKKRLMAGVKIYGDRSITTSLVKNTAEAAENPQPNLALNTLHKQQENDAKLLSEYKITHLQDVRKLNLNI